VIGDNTLVIYLSDNGGDAETRGINGKLRGTKTEMYEGGICVEAIS